MSSSETKLGRVHAQRDDDPEALRTQIFAKPQPTLARPQPSQAIARKTPKGQQIPRQAAQFIYSTVRRLALQQDLAEAEHVLTRSLLSLSASDRAYCLYYRQDSGAVWSYRRPAQSSEMSPGKSLAALSAEHGEPLCLRRADTDARYLSDVDDPFGDGSQQIMIHPVVAMDQVVAVLVVVRDADKDQYSPLDYSLVQHMARESASMIVHFLGQMLESHHRSQEEGKGQPSIFRKQAMDHRDNESALGEVVQTQQRWLSWAFRILIVSAIAGALIVFIVPVHQYASGSSVIRMEGSAIRATFRGTVEKSYVASGDKVVKGQLLITFRSAEEESNFAEIDQQYQQQLVALLEDPSDKSTRATLRSLVAQREQAKSKAEALHLRANKSGIVSDLRARPGQLVDNGQPVLTIVDEDALPTLTAFLPGNFRPKLKVGMTLRFRLAGYARSEQEATIEWISREVVGPAEARRYLGPDMADAIPVGGPVVLVKARLSGAAFVSEGNEYRFHNGMYGSAEVEVGSETILSSLLNRK